MKKLVTSLVAVCLACIGGCTTGNDVFEPLQAKAGQGVLYVYRPEASTPGVTKPLRLSYPEVFIDDRSVGTIPYNSYIAVPLAPGQHRLRLTGLTAHAKDWEIRDINRNFNMASGKPNFMRFRVEYNLKQMNLLQPGARYTILLTPVSEQDAIYEIRHTNPAK